MTFRNEALDHNAQTAHEFDNLVDYAHDVLETWEHGDVAEKYRKFRTFQYLNSH